jgi:hypothetical protein
MTIRAPMIALAFGTMHFACVVRLTLAEIECKEHCATALVAVGRILEFPLSDLVRLYRESSHVHGHVMQWAIATVFANSLVWAAAMWLVLVWFGTKRPGRSLSNQ